VTPPPHPRYPQVFSPFRLGPVEVANRIYFPPHGIALDAPVPGHESHAQPAAERAYYFAERAAGGVGLVFHSTQIGPFAAQWNLHESPGLAEAVPSYRKVAELVHAEGAKIMAQIWYVPWGPHQWEALGPLAPQLAPSPVANYYTPTARYAMRRHDIEAMIREHARAGEHLKQAGYDGVELHASHGSTLEYFLSPRFNRRTDEYGGGLEGRARLLLEAGHAVRRAAGDGMAVGLRLTADELFADGITEDETRAILAHLDASGVFDFVDLDISVEPEQRHLMTTGPFIAKLHNAERVKRIAPAAGRLAVLATPGRVTAIAEADAFLASSSVGMVGIARGLIAEPDLVNHARDGLEERSRTCIAVNHCISGVNSGLSPRAFGCAINAVAGREERWSRRVTPAAPHAMSVAVVGGGPAGLEAARVTASRGHRVTLYEREAALGGGAARWARLPGREYVRSLVSWFELRLDELEVDVQLGHEATADELRRAGVVVVATGSVYDAGGASGFAPGAIDGVEGAPRRTVEDVSDGDVRLDGTVLVLDDEGLHAAAGIAELAAAHGADVLYVTRKLLPGDALVFESQDVETRLRAAGVEILTTTAITRFAGDVATLTNLKTQEQRELRVDAFVPAAMRVPVDALADELEELDHVYLIGDALAPRTLREATYEGHRFGRLIGDPDMPRRTTDQLFQPLNALRPASTIP
jgi:2,4-dienoyl-CoA reductase (NADPH2)